MVAPRTVPLSPRFSATLTIRRTLSRLIRTKPYVARLLVLLIFLLSTLLGVALHAWWAHSQVLLARALDAHTQRYTNATLALSTSRRAPGVTLVSSLYSARYSTSRIAELRVVVLRNLALRAVSRYELLVESGTFLPPVLQNASASGRLATTHLRADEPVTYAALLARANAVTPAGSVAVVANADIYFDESLLCAGLLSPRVALALSRHPSPDCAAASARGDTAWEPADFCAGYDPVRAASHDAFAFVAPLDGAVIARLGALRVNEFGAENVVVWALRRAGLRVVNPCANVHAFHQHCDARARAREARQRSGSVAERRGEFAGAERWGFVDVATWGRDDFTEQGLDCLSYGAAG